MRKVINVKSAFQYVIKYFMTTYKMSLLLIGKVKVNRVAGEELHTTSDL